jgi:hypothetical protein
VPDNRGDGDGASAAGAGRRPATREPPEETLAEARERRCEELMAARLDEVVEMDDPDSFFISFKEWRAKQAEPPESPRVDRP